MVEALDTLSGDPGRIHEEAMASRVSLETARQQVADLLGARSREVVFTSSATEAIASAVFGLAQRAKDKSLLDDDGRTHQVVTAVEHSAVRHSAARHGNVTVVPVGPTGRVDPDDVIRAIGPNTAGVHVQWANHEVGTTQPIFEIVEACKQRKVPVHVDAAQAVGRVPVSFSELGADLMSFSGHKIGGPAGTGALLVRRGLRIPPLLLGGDQERSRRAGLEPVAALVGLGAAAAELCDSLDEEIDRAQRQGERLRQFAQTIEGIVDYGDPDHRVGHLVCLGVEGVEPQGVLLGLNSLGVSAHSGSACSSESLEPSPVLEAMGVDAHHSLRISVGWNTTDEDIDRAIDALPKTISHLRNLAVSFQQ